MKPLYWLLARCQQAVWDAREAETLLIRGNYVTLEQMGLRRVYADLFYVALAPLFGFGPLLVQ